MRTGPCILSVHGTVYFQTDFIDVVMADLDKFQSAPTFASARLVQ